MTASKALKEYTNLHSEWDQTNREGRKRRAKVTQAFKAAEEGKGLPPSGFAVGKTAEVEEASDALAVTMDHLVKAAL